MHYQISILTGGENQEQARTYALEHANRLVDEGEFDYYQPETSATYQLASKIGKLTVERALKQNRAAFDAAMVAVRCMVAEFTDEQIYQDDYGDGERDYFASRWQFSQVGDGHVYLYGGSDIWGEAIRNDKDFQAATEGHHDLWVTSMDFHN
jgi:hypothetical protein